MAKTNKSLSEARSKRSRPASTAEGFENQIIAAANDLAYQQILDGTVSSQVLVHYLKLGSSRNQLEAEKIRKETALLESKKNLVDSSQHIEELYSEAIKAFRGYRGESEEDVEVFHE